MRGWAVAAALASALCYALAAAWQHSEADSAPDGRREGLWLLWHLVRQPRWIAGIAAMAGGAGLHIVALSVGPLPLVQPIGVAGLLFALPIEARLHRRTVPARDWWAATAVAAGLTVFLRVLHTAARAPHLSNTATIVLTAATGAGVGLCALWSRHARGRSRAVALACGAGIAFGACSALARAVGAHVVAAGPGALFGWPTLAVAVVTPVGFVLCQHAYRDGSLGAALSTMTVVDPLIAVAFAAGLLGETLHTGPLGAATATGAAAIVVAGIVVLAHSPTRLPPAAVAGHAEPPAPAELPAPRHVDGPLTRIG